MPSRTRKMTPNNPATANPTSPDVPASKNTKDKIWAYGLGYQDAINATADMSRDRTGRRALDALRDGDPKPYRRLARRRRPG